MQVFLDKWQDVDYTSSFEDALILASVQANQIGENNVRILGKETMKINIFGKAGEHNCSMELAEKIDCQDDFVEYLDESFAEKLVCGYMTFVNRNGVLFTKTQYEVKDGEELTQSEIWRLMSYTQGQWSDGLGESFEQYPVAENEQGEEVYISPWFGGQTTEFEIVK